MIEADEEDVIHDEKLLNCSGEENVIHDENVRARANSTRAIGAGSAGQKPSVKHAGMRRWLYAGKNSSTWTLGHSPKRREHLLIRRMT